MRVLVAGLGRSGTTWVGRVLGLTGGTRYVHEPDNHHVRPEAWAAKAALGPFPRLVPGEVAPHYAQLFDRAFAGGTRATLRSTSARLVHRVAPGRTAGLARGGAAGRPVPAPGPVVVKSVFCARSVEWLTDRFDPATVVLCRHPYSVIASWEALGWDGFLDGDAPSVHHCAATLGVAPPRQGSPWIDRAAWHFGYLTSLLTQAAARHPDWAVVDHEALCARPESAFVELTAHLGLEWTPEAAAFLRGSDRPGTGYATNRVTAREADAWKTRLERADRRRVDGILEQFPWVGGLRSGAACESPAHLDTVRSLALSRVEC